MNIPFNFNHARKMSTRTLLPKTGSTILTALPFILLPMYVIHKKHIKTDLEIC